MSNMAYCRMENTLEDLRDCYDKWDDANSEDEIKARERILKLCKQIIKKYGNDE